MLSLGRDVRIFIYHPASDIANDLVGGEVFVLHCLMNVDEHIILAHLTVVGGFVSG